MFYEVRILDRKGNIKKVLSSQQLSKHYWEDFQSHLHGQPTPTIKSKGRKGPRKQKMVGSDIGLENREDLNS